MPLTASGFERKTLAEIKTEIETELKSIFGNSVDLSPSGFIGQIVGILSEREALIEAGQESIYYSQYWNTAEGNQLDNAAQLVGQERLSALATAGTVTFTGTDTTVIPAGFQVFKSGSPNEVYATDSEVTISGTTVNAAVTAVNTGELTALAGTVTGIVSSLTGVDSVTNAAGFDAGRNRETDSEFRIRIADSLQRPGTSTAAGIRAAVLALEDVISCSVTENETDVTVDGIPPHAFETFVFDDNAEPNSNIAQAILDAKPSGIQTHGATTETVQDSQGTSYDIKFTRPAEIDIYIIVNVTKNTDISEGPTYPANGDQLVEDAVLAYGSTRRTPNLDIIRIGIESAITTAVPGVTDLDVRLGTAPAPTGAANIAIDIDEISAFDAANVTVNS